jgi:phenylacetic acid degradation operon negative regulatory protein
MTVVPEVRQIQPRHLIVTVYGLYGRSDPGWLSVAALIRLLGDLGVEEPAVRSAISRLKRRGMLVPRRRDAMAGYELSPGAREMLREGDERIFRRDRGTLEEGWLLAVFSVPEAERHRRHVLRSELTRLGFGMVAPGVWIVPAHAAGAASAALRRLGLDAYADLFRADHLAFGDLAGKVRRWWNLDELQRLYRHFVAVHDPVVQHWRAAAPAGADAADGGRAFADYMRALTDWRRLPYLDPGLPAELLPADWIGVRAADVFFTIRSLLAGPASEFVATIVPVPCVNKPAGNRPVY